MEHSPMRALADAGAVALVAGSMAKILPPLAAAAAIVWYGIQIWQSETGKAWRARWRRLFQRQLRSDDYLAFSMLVLGTMGVMAWAYVLGGGP